MGGKYITRSERRSDVSIVGETGFMNIATRFEISVNAASLSPGAARLCQKRESKAEVNDIELAIYIYIHLWIRFFFFRRGEYKKKGSTRSRNDMSDEICLDDEKKNEGQATKGGMKVMSGREPRVFMEIVRSRGLNDRWFNMKIARRNSLTIV